MTRERILGSRPLLYLLLAVDLAMGAVYVADFAFGHPLGSLSRFIDLDYEANLPTWYSSMQLFAIGLVFAMLAVVEHAKEGNAASPYQIGVLCWLATAFTFFSLDEAAEIHENLGGLSDALLPGGDRENTLFAKTGIWMFIVFIPAAAFGLALVSFIRAYATPRAYRTTMLIGVTVFFGSALGVEIFSNWARQGALKILQVTCEEEGEMIGASIILWATFDLLMLKLRESGWPGFPGPKQQV